MSKVSRSYGVPFAFEMYGRINITLPGDEHTDSEIVKAAEKALEKMTTREMIECSQYLPDSEEIDYEGTMLDYGIIEEPEEEKEM